MITYRHHVVSLVAVFLALAVGVVLGGGPLSDLGREEHVAARAAARTQEARAAATFGDDFAASVAETLYADRLAERPVAVLAMPGADDEVVAGLGDQLALAGGSVAARYDVQDALVDPDEKSLVDTLAGQLAAKLPAGSVDEGASTYALAGQLLGLAVATDDGTADPAGEAADQVRLSLAGAELMVSPKGDPALAPGVLVVLPERSATQGPDTAAADAVLSGLLVGLAQRARAVVVVGSTESGETGVLAGLRRAPGADAVATVDGVESALGQVTATLAMLRALAGQVGAYGPSGADGAVPLG